MRLAPPPNELISPTSRWYVTDWLGANPGETNEVVFTNYVNGPFGFPANYATTTGAGAIPPLPPITSNTNPAWSWTNGHTIVAHYSLNLSGYSPKQLANVLYSTAIDNSYSLSVNGSNVDYVSQAGATWGSQSLPQTQMYFSVLPNLVAGSNSVDVTFWGDLTTDYFSMIVTTNICGQ